MSPAAGSPRPNAVLALAGPTAAGKTEVALQLAFRVGGEIVSVDSMQVYRGMDIGTAKPSAEQRARVAHHLIDVATLDQSFSAAQFVSLANEAVENIRTRGRVPILCGGTGLYFRAFFDGIGEAPAASPAIRRELEITPLAELLPELESNDPVTYARIDRRNPRRVIRALEVIRLTGRPYSLQRSEWQAQGSRSPVFVLVREPGDLEKRIHARVDYMFAAGLVSETEALLKEGLDKNRTALQALGYRQVADYLRGARSLPETIALVKIRTRQFAKRQMTWFRRQFPAVEWIHAGPSDCSEKIAQIIGERWAACGQGQSA